MKAIAAIFTAATSCIMPIGVFAQTKAADWTKWWLTSLTRVWKSLLSNKQWYASVRNICNRQQYFKVKRSGFPSLWRSRRKLTRQSASFVAVLLAGFAIGVVNASILPDVPSSIPDPPRSALETKHSELKSRLGAYNARIDQFNASCNSVPEHSDQAQTCRQQQASLQTEKAGILASVNEFKRQLAGAARRNVKTSAGGDASSLATIDKQIAETEKQLRTLTLNKSVPQFQWFAGQSQQAQEHMVSRLISRVRDYAIGKSEAAMQDYFLGYIRTMKPKDVKKLADFFQSKGANDPLFQEWLRSFSPNASRAVLVDGAKLAIGAVKKNKDLFDIGDNTQAGTVEGKQDAALTVLSMVADYPGLRELQEVKGFKELKAAAGGLYDVGEAWLTIYYLDRGINELSSATETQLADQKVLAKRMKDLVDERKALIKH